MQDHRAGGRQRPDLPALRRSATCTIRSSTSTSPPIAAAPAADSGSGSRSSGCSGTPSAASSAAATSCAEDQLRRQPGRDPHAGLRQAIGSGAMKGMLGMVEQCMGDYDENGWTVPHLHNPDDINVLDRIRQRPRRLRRLSPCPSSNPGSKPSATPWRIFRRRST